MPPAFNRAASTLHALTILSFCLHFVQAAGEPANASVNSKLISEAAAAHPGTVSNDSVRSPPAAEAGSNAAKTLSVSLDSSTVQQPGEQHSATHGLSTASSSNETAATPSWLLTQQDSCPADQATATAEHVTGTLVSVSEPAASSTPSPKQDVPDEAQQQHEVEEQQQRQQQDDETDSIEEDRHNFALSKDGAKIVACNKEAKKCSAILDTDSDTFMKNDCKADKWLIMELSQVAKVDAFEISQYELYSSRVKEFEVRGRQTHPRGQGSDYSKALNTSGWQLLGKYSAAKSRGTQAFTVAHPVWLKYLQFHFITQYGSEPMCALNDVLVHGKSAAEDLEDQLSASALLPEDDLQPVSKPDGVKQQLGAAQQSAASAETALAVQQEAGNNSVTNVLDDVVTKERPGTGDANAALHAVALDPVQSDSAAKVPKVSPERVPAGSDILIELSAQAGLVSAKDMSHNIGNPEPGATATSTSKASDSAQATDAMHEELLLMPNSASSNKARHGGSIYDMLVQEIKSLKLQQKLAPRQFAELQKNMSVYVNRTAAEISALQQSVQLLQSEVRLLKRSKNASEKLEFSGAAVATSSDVEIDLRALHHQLEVVRAALHIVQHRVTAIVLMAMVAWLAVMVLTAPDLGRMTWILYVPIIMISAIGVLWLAGVLRILPNHFTVP